MTANKRNFKLSACKAMRLSAAVLAALFLSACIKPPNRVGLAPVSDMPARWYAAPNATTVAPSRLANFSDPDLQRLVKEAISANFDLFSAAARVFAARATVRIAGSGRWPQLFFAPAYQRGEEHSVNQPTETFNHFQALFELNWELDVWGRIKDASTASAYDAEAAGNDFSAAWLSLAARTAQAYFVLSEANL